MYCTLGTFLCIEDRTTALHLWRTFAVDRHGVLELSLGLGWYFLGTGV